MSDQVVKTEIVIDAVSEATLIVTACADRDARDRLARRLGPEHFLDPKHRLIWAGIQKLHAKGLDFDVPTLRAFVGEQVPGDYVGQLLTYRPPESTNEDFHVQKVLWQRVRAEAAAGPLTALLDALRKPQEEPHRVAALAHSLARTLDDSAADDMRFLAPKGETTRLAMAEIRRKRSGIAVFPTGIDALDYFEASTTLAPRWMPVAPNGRKYRLMPGAAPGLVTTLTGVSGSGKSAIAKLLALLQAGQGRRVLYGAWEETKDEVLAEMAAISLGLSRAAVRVGHVTDEEEARLERRMGEIEALVSFLDYPFERQPSQSRDPAAQALRNMDTLQKFTERSAADVVFCDLFDRALDSDDPRVAKPVLFRVQGNAKQTRAHHFLLAQQKIKGFEGERRRRDFRPTRENIMGSQAWVDISDAIVGLYRPYLYRGASVGEDVCELIILKQRRGPWPMIVEVVLDMDRGRIHGGTTRSFDIGEESEDALGVNVQRSNKRGFNAAER